MYDRKENVYTLYKIVLTATSISTYEYQKVSR